MANVADFVVIRGETPVRIGDSGNLSWEVGELQNRFNIRDPDIRRDCFLAFMVRGLTQVHEDVAVKINNQHVGTIRRYYHADSRNWFTQTIHFLGEILNNGYNELQVDAVQRDFTDERYGSDSGVFDDFELKNIVCHFHRETETE